MDHPSPRHESLFPEGHRSEKGDASRRIGELHDHLVHAIFQVHRTPSAKDDEDAEGLPIKMLNDRILVSTDTPEGERRSSGGILIPATAQMARRLIWAEVVATGPNVRAMEVGDQVLFNPEDRYEVEVRGSDHIILRERDVHAVAAQRLEEGSTGLYL